MTTFSSAVGWKVEFVRDEPGYLAEISKKSVEGAVFFLLAAHSKKLGETDNLRKELLSKKEPEFDGWECSKPIQRAENRAKVMSG